MYRDTAHAPATHESSYTAAKQTAQSRFGGKSPYALQVMAANGEPSAVWEGLEIFCFDYGHSYFRAIYTPPQEDENAHAAAAE